MSLQMRVQEGKHAIESIGNYGTAGAVEAVAAIRNCNQFMFHAGLSERLRHHHGLLVRHIGVLIPVEQQCGRVILGHVTNGAEWVKGRGFCLRIITRYLPGPEALLSAVEIEAPSVVLARGF